eukprot:Mycagemm_TRINITY_DN8211_c0_g1::TRINITY_DN8211_c0_g1_i1::g.1928::m.1928 type:complete len:110 gc:universal TRINITY_DN8211_c0_g1_i1:377-48(-)
MRGMRVTHFWYWRASTPRSTTKKGPSTMPSEAIFCLMMAGTDVGAEMTSTLNSSQSDWGMGRVACSAVLTEEHSTRRSRSASSSSPDGLDVSRGTGRRATSTSVITCGP